MRQGGDDIALGRTAARVIVAGTVLSSVIMLVIRVRTYGLGILSMELFRFAIAVSIVVLAYRGVRWARWACAAIFAIAGILGVFVAISQRGNPANFGLTAGFAVFYLISGYLLLRSPALRAFLDFQGSPD